MPRRKHMYTFPNGMSKYHGLVEISDDNYVNGIPIEDYGDYLLTDSPTNTPLEDWFKAIDNDAALEEWKDKINSVRF